MSAQDAHYAGELVDGARILALFGDLATELLIRLDGNEGLFRAYETVEFLAPVFAGDYVEVTGELTAVGHTSRQMRFEARKVIAAGSRSGWGESDAPADPRAPGAADVLRDPIVVARAVGTCVVPRSLQRKPRELYLPGLPAGPAPTTGAVTPPPPGSDGEVILTAAIVGAELTRAKTPHLPITPDEVADEAARCREAGAAIIHLHVRDDDGLEHAVAERFSRVIDAIRSKCDCIIQASTGGAVGMSIDERASPLVCRPRWRRSTAARSTSATTCSSTRGRTSARSRRRIRAAGVLPELECYEVGHVEEALALASEGLVPMPAALPVRAWSEGRHRGARGRRAFLRSLVPSAATWAVAATGRFQQPMTELAMRLGGHARVGLEDNIYLSKGVLSEGARRSSRRAAAYARSIGRPPATPRSARQLLGLGESR
jgi:3-keto-5-aminohexanoate cleavage enzyme